MIELPPKLPLWLPPKPAIIRPAPEIKHASFLPGMFPAGALAAAAEVFAVEFIQRYANDGNGPIYTFSTSNLGPVSTTRRTLLTIHSATSGSQVINSVTVGGLSATVRETAAGDDREAYVADVDTSSLGATADIVVNKAGSPVDCTVAVWRMVKGASTPTDSGSDAGSVDGARGLTLTVPAGGYGVWCATSGEGSVTWTNATEQYDTSGVSNGFASGAIAFSAGGAIIEAESSSARGIAGFTWAPA